jgi:hypothetical protein
MPSQFLNEMASGSKLGSTLLKLDGKYRRFFRHKKTLLFSKHNIIQQTYIAEGGKQTADERIVPRDGTNSEQASANTNNNRQAEASQVVLVCALAGVGRVGPGGKLVLVEVGRVAPLCLGRFHDGFHLPTNLAG